MYFSRTPHIARLLYPDFLWRMDGRDKSIYITFDDGPDPGVTPDALDLLDAYGAKATFFCVGDKVDQHTGLYTRLLENGHATGNHTHNHLKGTDVDAATYLESVEKAAALIRSPLFRPPYGRITRRQAHMLKDRYTIVMWSVLSGDFDSRRSKEDVRDAAIKHTKSGSIVVFHDNMKFREKMLFALEGFLHHFREAGFRFLPLDPDKFKG